MAIAVLCVVTGAGIGVWGIARGEWRYRRPEMPHAHRLLLLGTSIFIGGALLTVVIVVALRAGIS